METTANRTLIGIFTLVVLAAGFVFIYWVARGGEDENARPITVLFSDPVAGLTQGSPVTFNGLRVGEVTNISLDPENPRHVRVRLAVDASAPVKKDTKAFLTQPSLTGLVVVDLSGGSPDADSVWYADNNPVLEAEPSGLADLITNARRTLAKVDGAMNRVETLIDENAGKIDQAVANVQQFTEALSQNSEGIGTLLASVSKAADAISRVSDPLERIIARGDTIAESIEPRKVRETIDSLNAFSAAIGNNAGNVDQIVTRLSTASADMSAFAGRLAAIGDRTEGLVTDVGGKANRLLDAVEPAKVQSTLDSLASITASIEPAEVRSAISGIADLSATLSARSEDIDNLVTQLSVTASDVSAFTRSMPGLGERLNSVLAAVDAQKITASIDSVHSFTAALDGRDADIDQIMDSAKAVASRFDSITARADALLAKLNGLAGSGESGDVIQEARATLQSVRTAADSFSEQSASIGGGVNGSLRELQNFIREGQRVVARLDRVISNLERNPGQFLLGGGERVPGYSVGNRR